MIKFGYAFVVSFLLASNCHAENIDKSLIKVVGTYQAINIAENLPTAITDFFNKRELCPGIANPETEFNSSCDLASKIPCNRLISAGHSNDIWFINYESGGGAHTYNFLAFRLKNNSISSLIYKQERAKLTIEEIDSQLPVKESCETKDIPYYYKAWYGLCPSLR